MKKDNPNIINPEKRPADSLVKNKEYQELLKKIELAYKKLTNLYAVKVPQREVMEKVNQLHDEHKLKDADIKHQYETKKDNTDDPKVWGKIMVARAMLRAKLMLEYLNKEIAAIKSPIIYAKNK